MNQFAYGLDMVWAVLAVVGNWLLFRKAGKPGWHSIIPILNMIDEFDLCWSGVVGFFYGLLLVVVHILGGLATISPSFLPGAALCILPILIINWIQSQKLAASFGKSFLYGVFLFFCNRIARVILGLSSAEYVGRQ